MTEIKEYCLSFLTNEFGGVIILLLLLILIFIFSTTHFNLAGLLRYIILTSLVLFLFTKYRDHYLFNPFTDIPKRKDDYHTFGAKYNVETENYPSNAE